MKKILLLGASLFIFACSQKVDMDKFSKTYTEILVVRETVQDSTKANEEVQKILTAHGYTMESYKKEFDQLVKDPKQMMNLYSKIKIEARRQADSIRKNMPKDTNTSNLQAK